MEAVGRPEHREIAARFRMEILSALHNNDNGPYVYLAREPSSLDKFVLKFYDDYGVSDWERETAALAALSGAPNIVRVHSKSPDGNPAWLALDYLPHRDLVTYFELCEKRVEYDNIRIFFRDVLTALLHVHGAGLVHLDLKPDNIYIQTFKNQMRAILADFGTAQPGDLVVPKPQGRVTRKYAPPEFHHSPIRISPSFDVWCLGASLYTMLTGRFAFGELGPATTLADIEGAPVIDRLEYALADRDTPGEAIDAIMQMLRFNPEDRVTLSELNRHPFFSLELEPVMPVGARQAVKDQIITSDVPDDPTSSPHV
jgi:serine/threonine protein kinase